MLFLLVLIRAMKFRRLARLKKSSVSVESLYVFDRSWFADANNAKFSNAANLGAYTSHQENNLTRILHSSIFAMHLN